MRKRTVNIGLNMISAGILLIILATFFHEQASRLLFLPTAAEARFVFLGLFWGGTTGCFGILVTVAGMLRREIDKENRHLALTLIILGIVTALFFMLLFTSFTTHGQPRLRPGETITI